MKALVTLVFLGAVACRPSYVVGVIVEPATDVSASGSPEATTLDAATFDATTLDATTLDATTLDVSTDLGFNAETSTDIADVSDANDVVEASLPPCGTGMLRCGAECVRPLEDVNHCGRCGVRCRSGCINGQCGEMVRDLALGVSHSCVVRVDGRVLCWGSNSSGQLGDGGYIGRCDPQRVIGVVDAAQVVAGESHTCVRRSAGRMSCWGDNSVGQLGRGTLDPSVVPLDVRGMSDTRTISVGLGFSCAVDGPGRVWCWGFNERGTLGLGHVDDLWQPERAIATLSDVRSVGCGSSHACALQGGGVSCWGQDVDGQLGRGASGPPALEPGRIPRFDLVADVGVGLSHTCALRDDGTVWCWGSNFHGQLGDGTREARSSPVRVAGLENIRQIAVAPGQDFSCALDASNQAWCWGSNEYGQLGRGTFGTAGVLSAPERVRLPPGLEITLLRAGGSRACILLQDGRTILCWGWNDSCVLGGDPSVDRTAIPTEMRIPAEVP